LVERGACHPRPAQGSRQRRLALEGEPDIGKRYASSTVEIVSVGWVSGVVREGVELPGRQERPVSPFAGIVAAIERAFALYPRASNGATWLYRFSRVERSVRRPIASDVLGAA
jgi:hypothetical protein